MRQLKSAFCACVALMAGACGGGGDGSSGGGSLGYCSGSFAGGLATVESACPVCSVDSPAASIDDNGQSFATITYGPSGGNVVIRASAPEGMTFPTGANAGALMRFPTGIFTSIGVRFNTYRDGQPVDTLSGGALTVVGSYDNPNDNYLSLTTSGEIDTIEAVVTLSGNAQSESVRLYEFCGDR